MAVTTTTIRGRAGLAIIAAAFVIAVLLVNSLPGGLRLDLTENRLYTLSEGTQNILDSIDEPINIYFFYSDRATENIPALRTYAGRVREMLEEFAQQADGRLRVKIIDPLPFSEEEDRAAEFGMQGITLPAATDPVFMGIAGTNSVGDEEIIPFLDPGKETFLEYDLAKLIHSLADPERPVVALMSDLPMIPDFDPQRGQLPEPWVVVNEMRALFDVRSLPTSATTIGDDVDVLMVVHPKSLSDATLYAIDQFILRGGRALLAVDPFSEIDVPRADPSNPGLALSADRGSQLDGLLSAWGIKAETGEVIGDDRYALTVAGTTPRPVRHIGLIGIGEAGINGDDVITSGIRSLNFGFAGHLDISEDAPVDVTPLVQSSDLAGPIDTGALMFLQDPSALREGFSPTGKRYVLAARLGGRPPSAFPEGPPGDAADGGAHLAAAAGRYRPADRPAVGPGPVLFRAATDDGIRRQRRVYRQCARQPQRQQ